MLAASAVVVLPFVHSGSSGVSGSLECFFTHVWASKDALRSGEDVQCAVCWAYKIHSTTGADDRFRSDTK